MLRPLNTAERTSNERRHDDSEFDDEVFDDEVHIPRKRSFSSNWSMVKYRTQTVLPSKKLVSSAICFLFALSTAVLAVYIFILKLMGGSYDPDVYNRRMVIYSMPNTYFTLAQGMYAEFLAVIGALHYGTIHRAASVRVFFDSDLYVDKSIGPNWWEYFFEHEMPLRTPIVWEKGSPAEISHTKSEELRHLSLQGDRKLEVEFSPALSPSGVLDPNGTPQNTVQEVHFTNWIARFGKLGSFSRMMTNVPYKPSGLFAKFPYPVHGTDISVSHGLVQKHIRIKKIIARKFDSQRRKLLGPAYVYPYSSNNEVLSRTTPRCRSGLATECNELPALSHLRSDTSLTPSELLSLGGTLDGVFIIGVHYRGLDKVDAYPYRLTPPDLFRVAVSEVLEVYKPKDYLIFVASDTSDFIPFAKAHWGEDKVVAIDAPRIFIKDMTYQPNGVPVPVHKSGHIPNYEKAESAVLDMLFLAASNYIVKNRSSLSDTSLAMAPNKINYTIILGADDPVYSTDPRMSIHPEFSDSDFDIYNPRFMSSKHVRRAGLSVPNGFVPYT